MEQSKIREIKKGIESAFIEETYNSNLAYSPLFVRNDFRNGAKVLSQIEKELRACDEFSISVAFINKGGFIVLSETLKELEARGNYEPHKKELSEEERLKLEEEERKIEEREYRLRNYLKRKANVKQKEYEERYKERRKQEKLKVLKRTGIPLKEYEEKRLS